MLIPLRRSIAMLMPVPHGSDVLQKRGRTLTVSRPTDTRYGEDWEIGARARKTNFAVALATSNPQARVN